MEDDLQAGLKRSTKIKKNVVSLFFINGMSVLVNLILVPITINFLDETRYGIWVTLSSIILWMSFLDIGLGNGLRNNLAESIAKKDTEKAKIFVSTAYVVLTLILIAALIVFSLVSGFINWSTVLNAPPAMTDELSVLALVVFSFFCLKLILNLILTIAIADQNPAIASSIQLIGNFLALCIIYWLTQTVDGSLLSLGLALSISPIVVLLIASFVLFRTRYSEYAPSIKFVRFSHGAKLLSLGLKFFAIQIAAILLYQTSNIVISHLFGPSSVTPYNIAFRYFGVLTMISAIVISPFWSAITDAFSRNDLVWITQALSNLRRVFVIFLGLAMIMVIVAEWVYEVWVGPAIRIPTGLSVVLAVYVVINVWNAIYSNCLNGLGVVKLQMVCSVISAIINVPLAILLGHQVGIEGVVLATVIVSCIGAILYPIQLRKFLAGDARGIWSKQQT